MDSEEKEGTQFYLKVGNKYVFTTTFGSSLSETTDTATVFSFDANMWVYYTNKNNKTHLWISRKMFVNPETKVLRTKAQCIGYNTLSNVCCYVEYSVLDVDAMIVIVPCVVEFISTGKPLLK
jgi:hypothetical protein